MLKTWTKPVEMEPQDRVRLADLADYYHQVIDRTGEVIQATLRDEYGQIVSEEVLFFCPLMDFVAILNALHISVEKRGDGDWDINIVANSVVKMVMLDGNNKYLCSENYLALTPHQPRRIILSMLEHMNEDAPVLTVSAKNSDEVHQIALP